VRVLDGEGSEFARGLASHGAAALGRICGRGSKGPRAAAGDDEAIRRSDLVVL
jgi:hypothetical protein